MEFVKMLSSTLMKNVVTKEFRYFVFGKWTTYEELPIYLDY